MTASVGVLGQSMELANTKLPVDFFLPLFVLHSAIAILQGQGGRQESWGYGPTSW